jgi:hypothetical protein
MVLRLLVALFVWTTANLVPRTVTHLLVAVVASVEAVALVTVAVVAAAAALAIVEDEVEDVAVVSAIVAVEEVAELLPTVEDLAISPERRRHSKPSKATLSRILFYDTLYH